MTPDGGEPVVYGFGWLRDWASWLIFGLGAAISSMTFLWQRGNAVNRKLMDINERRVDGLEQWRERIDREHAVITEWRQSVIRERAMVMSQLSTKPDRAEVQGWFESLREDIRQLNRRQAGE